MTVSQMQDKCFGHALSHGFIRKNMSVEVMLCEVYGEVNEALDASRAGRRADFDSYIKEGRTNEAFAKYIKDSLEDELADTVMRVATLCGYLGIDLQRHIKEKADFNKNRGYLHGKK